MTDQPTDRLIDPPSDDSPRARLFALIPQMSDRDIEILLRIIDGMRSKPSTDLDETDSS